MAWMWPKTGEIDRIIADVRAALVRAQRQLLSGAWVTSTQRHTAAAIQRYIDGPVMRWALTGMAYYGGADSSTLTGWKDAGQVHINAAQNWGVEGQSAVSMAVDTVTAIPAAIAKDVRRGVTNAGVVAGKVATGVVTGAVSSGFGLAAITLLAILGYLHFRR